MRAGVESKQSRARAAELFGLSGFAIAQPLLDLLSRFPAFFVAHDTQVSDLLIWILGLLFIPPFLAFAFERLAGLLGERFRTSARLIVNFGFGTLIGFAVAKNVPGGGAVIAGITFGAVVAFAAHRLAAFRLFLQVLSIAPVAFVLLFLNDSEIRSILWPDEVSHHAGVEIEKQIPVVMVIFDEFSAVSLLDEDERIDAIRFPNFARLAEQSLWYRNATAMHPYTMRALPQMLSGRLPDPTTSATIAHHPDNLFTLLAGSYEMNIVEAVTSLAPKEIRARRRKPLGDRVAQLSVDSTVVLAHRILPERLSGDLPPVGQNWGNFVSVGDPAKRSPEPGRVSRRARFDHFVQSIGACEEGCLNFIHVLFPHVPWQYLPSGREYARGNIPGMQFKAHLWAEVDWWVVQGQQRYLLQLGFTDRLLGTLLDRLEEVGIYDEALVIVTADHGISFHPGEGMRTPDMTRFASDVMRIPLFVKLPGQQSGEISDRNVQTFDIVPLIADVLGIDLPFAVDGCSPLDPACQEPDHKIMFSRGPEGKPVHYPADLHRDRTALDRQLALFGSGPFEPALYQIGPHPELIGTKRDDRKLGAPEPYRAEWKPPRLGRDRFDFFSPVRVDVDLVGVDPENRELEIAIVIDGTVHAVVPALDAGRGVVEFMAFVPESSIDATSRLEFFRVESTETGPVFHPIPTDRSTPKLPDGMQASDL